MDTYARQRGFKIRVFSLLGELPKAIEPHLPVFQLYRWKLCPNMWSSHTTKSIDPIVATAIRVGFPGECHGPATCGFACNCRSQRYGQRRRAVMNNCILFHDSNSKAELLSHQFKSVFTMDDDTDHLPSMSHPKYPNIENIALSIDGFEKLLNNISIQKAFGPDKIPNIIFMTYSNYISSELANIYQQSLYRCILPNDLINTNIGPISLKCNKRVARNYRPISLTSVCCKTSEHIIR